MIQNNKNKKPNYNNLGIPNIGLSLTQVPENELDKLLRVTNKPVTFNNPRMLQTGAQKVAKSIAKHYKKKSVDEKLGVDTDIYYEDALDQQINDNLQDFDNYYNKVDENGLTQYDKDLLKDEENRSKANKQWLYEKAIEGVKSANPMKSITSALQDMIGYGVRNSVDADLSSTLGQKQSNDLRIELAKAHQQALQLQKSINDDKQRRDQLQYIINNYDNKAALSELGLSTGSLSKRDYQIQLQKLDNRLYDSISKLNQLKEQDDAYKIMYAQDKMYPKGDYGLDIVGQWLRSANEFAQTSSLKDFLLTAGSAAAHVASKLPTTIGGGLYEDISQAMLDARDSSPRDLDKLNNYYINSYNNYVKDQSDNGDLFKSDNNLTSKYISQNEEDSKSQSEEYDRLLKARKSYDDFWNVSESYEDVIEKNSSNTNLLDPMYYLAVLPGVIGSSSSSTAQNVAQLANLASMALGPGGVVASSILTTPLQAMGGQEESYGIAGDLRVQQIREALQDTSIVGPKGTDDIYKDLHTKAMKEARKRGWDDAYASEYFDINTESGKNNILRELAIGNITTNDPRIRKVLLSSLKGTEAVRDMSNLRTGATLPITTAMNILPFAKMTGKFGLRSLGLKLPKVGESTKSYIEAFRKGANVGAEIGGKTGTGIAGQGLGYVTGGIIGAASQPAKKLFTGKAATILNQVKKNIGNKYNKILNKYLPIDSKRSLLAKYGLSHASASAFNAIDEAFEEGSQQIFQNSNLAEMYGFNTASTFDLLNHDIEAGLRTGQFLVDQVFGTNYSGMADDEEMLSNVVGGFAAGLFNINTILQASGAVKHANLAKDAIDAIREDVSTINESYGDVRDSYFTIAKQAMNGKSQYVNEMLDLAKSRGLVGEQEDAMFTNEQFQSSVDAVNTIDGMSRDKRLRGILQAKGIEYGTDRYATALADLYDIQAKLKENSDQNEQNNLDLQKFYNSKEFNDEVDKLVDRYTDENSTINGSAVSDRLNEARIYAERQKRNELKDNTELSDQEKDNLITEAGNEAVELERQYIRNTAKSNIRTKTQMLHKINTLYSLYKFFSNTSAFNNVIKEKLGINIKRPDSKLVLKYFENELKNTIDEYSKFFNQQFNKDWSFERTLLELNQDPTVVNLHNSDLNTFWARQAVLMADSKLLNSYLSRLEYGVIENKDGSYSYNVDEYKRRKKEREARLNAIKNEKEYTPETSEIQAKPGDVSTSPVSKDAYVNRVDKIMQSRTRHNRMNAMVQDIYEGDAVAQIEESSKKTDASDRVQAFDPNLDVLTNKKIKSDKEVQEKKKQNKEKYDALKSRVKQERREKILNRIRRKLSRANVDILGGVGDAINMIKDDFLSMSKIMSYSFQNFVDDVLAELNIDNSDSRYEDVINILRGIYRRYYNKASAEQKQNLEDVYAARKPQQATNIVERNNVKQEAKQLLEDRQKDIVFSSGYLTVTKQGDNYTVCTNESYIDNRESFDKFSKGLDVSFSVMLTRLLESEKQIKGDLTTNQKREQLQEAISYFVDEAVKHKAVKKSNNIVENIVRYIDCTSSFDKLYTVFKYLADHESHLSYFESNPNYSQLRTSVRDYLLQSVLLAQKDSRINGIIRGELIRQLTVQLLLDNNADVSKKLNLLNTVSKGSSYTVESFYNGINYIRKSLADRQETVIDTTSSIYATVNNQNVSSTADIVTVDNEGNIRLYDITTSKYKDIESRLDVVERGFPSVREREEETLKRSFEILYQIFGNRIKQCAVIPIHINDVSQLIYEPIFVLSLRGTNPIYTLALVTAKDLNDEYYQLFSSYEDLYNEATALIEELNVENAGVVLSPSEFDYDIKDDDNSDLYKEGVNTVITNLRQSIQELSNTVKQLQTQKVNTPLVFTKEQGRIAEQAIEDLPKDLQYYVKQLYSIFDNLVNLKAQIPQGIKITRLEEKNLIDEFYNNIIDAELLLDLIVRRSENLNNSDEINLAKLLRFITDCAGIVYANRQYYGKSILFTKWYNTNLSTVENDGYAPVVKYTKKINNYITLINNIIDSNITDENLIKWYSIVINTYFNKLLANAQIESDKQSVQGILNNVIASGKDSIRRYNERYGFYPNDQFYIPEDATVEDINSIDISWVNRYNVSDSNSPSFMSMKDNDVYVEISNEPDFVENSQFTFIRQNGQIKLHINYKGKECDLYFTTPKKDGVEQTPLMISENNANAIFLRKVGYMMDFVANNPQYKISFSVFTNKGKFIYSTTAQNNLQKLIFASDQNKHDLYKIKVSVADDIGVFQIVDRGSRHPRKCVVSENRIIYNPNSTYEKEASKIYPGHLIYVYKSGKDRIMTSLQSRVIGENDARLIYDLVVKYITGQDSVDGYNIKNLLQQRLFISFSDSTSVLQTMKYTSAKIKLLRGNLNVQMGDDTYNIYQDQQDIIKRISNMLNTTDVATLNSTLDDELFCNIKQRIGTNKQITLPNGLTFTADDIRRIDPNGDFTYSTYFGYLIRNNYIYSPVSGKSCKYLNITDLQLVDKSVEAENKTQKEETDDIIKNIIEQTAQQEQDDALDEIRKLFGQGLEMHGKRTSRDSKSAYSFMQDVADYMTQVFGDTAFLRFVNADNVCFKTASKNGRVVGMCSSDMITIAKEAPQSVKYHEAFHRIMELILPQNVRERFYEMYRKQNGRNLTDRQVAEGLADMFTSYGVNIVDYKKDKFWKKIVTFYKPLRFACLFARKAGFRRMSRFLNLYHQINNGTFKDRQISKEQQYRFKKLFGQSLAMTIKNPRTKENVEFSFISNQSEKRQMVKALGYLIIRNHTKDKVVDLSGLIINGETPSTFDQRLINVLCGTNVPEEKLLNQHRAFREVFEYDVRYRNTFKDQGYVCLKQVGEHRYEGLSVIENTSSRLRDSEGNIIGDEFKYYPKFAALAQDIANYIAGIYAQPSEDLRSDDSQDEDVAVANNNMDKFDKASHEFSKLDSVPLRVKQIFATVPYMTIDKNGNLQMDLSRNIFNVPQFIPVHEVYKVVLNRLHDVKSPQELYNRLQKESIESPMYRHLFNIYKDYYNSMYIYDKDGNIVKTNYDNEGFVYQMFQAISSQKMNFLIAKFDSTNKSKDIKIIDTTVDKDIANYPRLWYQNFISGRTGIVQSTVVNNKHYIKTTGLDIIKDFQKYVDGVKQLLISDNQQYKDFLSHKNNIDLIKTSLSNYLQQVGIQITPECIDYMLQQKYNDNGVAGLTQWLCVDTGQYSINQLFNFLNTLILNDLSINPNKGSFKSCGFVVDLAYWYGAYKKITTDNAILGLDGKTLNTMTQNNTISALTSIYNTCDFNNPTIQTLSQFNYCVDTVENKDGSISTIGSIIMKQMIEADQRKASKPNFVTSTLIGSKSTNRGVASSAYKEQAAIDDYMSKYGMLRAGYMLFPVFSDKSTWYALSGVKIPGIDTKTIVSGDSKTIVMNNTPSIIFYGDRDAVIRPCDDVLDQMLEYALTERNAIEQCLEDLKTLPEEAKIANYHTGKKRGTKFTQLTRLAVPDYKEGRMIGYHTISLVDSSKSSKELLDVADKYLFNLPVDQQRLIMALTLDLSTKEALRYAESQGVIQKRDISDIVNSTEDKYIAYTSDVLNEDEVSKLTNTYFDIYFANTNLSPEVKSVRREAMRGLAVASLIQDSNIRNIISTEEALRMYMGHPAFFKDFVDLSKRAGGVISTGDDNVISAETVGEEYTCAELQDYEPLTQSRIKNELEDRFVSGFIRDLYYQFGDKQTAYTKDLDEIKTWLNKNNYEELLNKAINNGKAAAKTYTTGINVADGATFITDIMCEKLLRIRGAYTEEIAEIFEMLRNDDTKYSWKDRVDAYRKIYNTAALVNQKYSAYGFRSHNTNGQLSSNIAVPYYNKTALFPLFPCIATGKMKGIYEKMLNEGVDVLFMNSSVKLGSQNPVEFNGESIDKPFTTYKQRFEFLRRQLNTDPEKENVRNLGTQCVKVMLQNLRLDKQYLSTSTELLEQDDLSGQVSGKKIFDTLMNAINNLAELGEDRLNERFFEDGRINNTALSDYLKSQLSSRDANWNLIQAIDTKTTENGTQLVAPLAATASSKWIESILTSTVNKEIIDIKLPGGSYVQRSVFAMEGSPYAESSGKIMSDEDMDSTINGGKRLEMYNENGSMDCVISISYFADIIPEGLTFNQAKQWLIDNNIIGPTTDATIVGYRIPTQAESSIHALRVVDVISAQQDTIILPADFVKITGSDFDIDHLYLFSHNYRIVKDQNGNPVSVSKAFDKNSNPDKYYQNIIVDCALTLLQDEDTFHLLYRSIDNDTELPKSHVNKSDNANDAAEIPFGFGMLHQQVQKKNDFMLGKFGIGPFALNITNQNLTAATGVKFKPTPFTLICGFNNLDLLLDVDGNYIQSWLSGCLNGNVDIVKDPWISSLNVNKYTYNMLCFLIRTGHGDFAFELVKQPIIREMARVTELANSQFFSDDVVLMSKRAYVDEQISKVVGDIAGLSPQQIDDIKSDINRALSVTPNDNGYNLIHTIRDLMNNIDRLRSASMCSPYDKFYTYNGGKYDLQSLQQSVFIAWTILERYANATSELVQYTKIDTKKHGKTILEQAAYYRNYTKLLNPSNPNNPLDYLQYYIGRSDYGEDSLGDQNNENTLFNIRSLYNLVTQTWIAYKTQHAIETERNILSNQVFTANDTFIKFILSLCGNVATTSQLQDLSNAAITGLKLKYIGKYAEHLGTDLSKLFVGDFTMQTRLNNLLYRIQTDDSLRRLKGNILLDNITVIDTRDPIVFRGEYIQLPQFITILQTVDQSSIIQDDFIEAWDQLLNDPNPAVVRFAKDLIIYAYITSGEYGNWNHLVKYVPVQWITGDYDNFQSFSDYIQELLDDSDLLHDNLMSIKSDIYRNNFTNRSLVKTISYNKLRQTQGVTFINNDQNNLTPLAIVMSTKVNMFLSEESTKKDVILIPYFNLKKPGKYNEENLQNQLYELVYLDDFTGVYVPSLNKGYHLYGGYDIYEYGIDLNLDINNTIYPKDMDFDKFTNKLSSTITDINRQTSEKTWMQNNKYSQYFENVIKSVMMNTYSEESAIQKESVQNSNTENDNTINIYYGTGENVQFSNFAQRPVTYGGITYPTPETAFQAQKLAYLIEQPTDLRQSMIQFAQTYKTGSSARAAGRKLNIDVQKWNEVADSELERIMFLSFVQNRNAANALYATGDAVFTHKNQQGVEQDNGRFSRLLTNVRSEIQELATPLQNVIGDVIIQSDVLFNRDKVAKDTKNLYIFTDNTDRDSGSKPIDPDSKYAKKYGKDKHYPTQTQAVLRGLDNAMPISTQHWCHQGAKGKSGQWTDQDLKEFSNVIHKEVDDIIEEWNTGKYKNIIIGIGDAFFNSKISEITIARTPMLFITLKGELERLAESVQINAESVQSNDVFDVDETLTILGGTNDEVAQSELSDATEVLNKGITFTEALSKVQSVFTEQEISQIKQATGGRLKVTSVSRYTDPAFYANDIVKVLEENYKKPFTDPTRINVIELWTKHDGEPIQKILQACKDYKVAPMVSFSITGMGDTAIEKGVLKYNTLLSMIKKLIDNGYLNPSTTTIRIDPILIGYTNMDNIRDIVQKGKSMGILKYVTSMVQSYGYLQNRYAIYDRSSRRTITEYHDNWHTDEHGRVFDENNNLKLGWVCQDRKVISGINDALAKEGQTYDWNKYYGVDKYGHIQFKPKQEYIDQYGQFLLDLKKNNPEITLQTCSFTVKGVDWSACLDPLIIERLTGVDVTRPDGTYDRDTSRPECMCYGVHGDFFNKPAPACYSSCAYCYMGHSVTQPFSYYNEDGTLINRPLTRVNGEFVEDFDNVDSISISQKELNEAKQVKEHCKGE